MAVTGIDIVQQGIRNDILDEPGKGRDNVVDPKTGATARGVSAQAAMAPGGSQAATAKRVSGPDSGNTFSMAHKKGGKSFTVKPDSDIDPVTGLPKSA